MNPFETTDHSMPRSRQASTSRWPRSRRSARRPRLGVCFRFLGPEQGQATAEYALVMLAAAALAGLLLAWASGTDGIGRLLDAVLDSLISDAER